jgi:hypothetical protein
MLIGFNIVFIYMKSLYKQSIEAKWDWKDWLIDEEAIQRMKEKKNIKITCKKCGKRFWRTQWRIHIRSLLHHINKHPPKKREIYGWVYFD